MLGPQLIMVLVYLWSRAYPTANVGFMGVVNFQARASQRPKFCAAFLCYSTDGLFLDHICVRHWHSALCMHFLTSVEFLHLVMLIMHALLV